MGSTDDDQRKLRAGEPIVGMFNVPRSEHSAAGMLRWSAEDGAMLEFAGEAPGFPASLDHDPFLVQGVTAAGTDLTLLGCRVRTLTFMDQLSRVSSTTLAWGARLAGDERWPKACFSTASLAEWRDETGLRFSRPAPKRRPHAFRIEWEVPPVDTVRVPFGELRFGPSVDYSIGRIPDWTVRTGQQMAVVGRRPMSIDAYFSRFADPLLALTTFASDRPDGLLSETYSDPGKRTRVEIWRWGKGIVPRDWRPGGFLFRAPGPLNFERVIRKWWWLYRRTWPALGVFADHVQENSSYSPMRFITVFSALEAYGNARRNTTDLKTLRRYAAVPSEVIGCTNEAIKLMGVSRGYFAHLNPPSQKYKVSDVDANAVESTRRASALMQACLLRELGYRRAERERMLKNHYSNWPVV